MYKKPSHENIMLEETKIDYVYLSVFDTHVKGGDCWSEIGFDKWVSTHLSHLLSSCQTSNTCWAQMWILDHAKLQWVPSHLCVESLRCQADRPC